MKMPGPSSELWDGLPDDLKLEMMLEMLVDDELPEGQRANLLRSLDSMPQQWRTLAIRFLERQTEHASVKEFIRRSSAASAAPAGIIYKFPASKSRHAARIAAGLILLAGLSGVMVIMMARKQPTSTPIASNNEVVRMPGAMMGTVNNADVPVTLVNTKDVPSSVLQGTLGNNSSRTVYIVPHGPDRAVIVPVTTAKEEIIY